MKITLLIFLMAINANCFAQADSVKVADLVRKAYQWHNRQITEDKGFDPRKAHSRDTLYNDIDLKAVNFMVNKYRNSGFFDDEFLNNYKALALRMDKELREKKAKWIEGGLPPFNHDADPWCNCGNAPGTYWQKIKILSVTIVSGRADVIWTWGSGLRYHVQAKKLSGLWKLTYLEGYDRKRYHWAAAQ